MINPFVKSSLLLSMLSFSYFVFAKDLPKQKISCSTEGESRFIKLNFDYDFIGKQPLLGNGSINGEPFTIEAYPSAEKLNSLAATKWWYQRQKVMTELAKSIENDESLYASDKIALVAVPSELASVLIYDFKGDEARARDRSPHLTIFFDDQENILEAFYGYGSGPADPLQVSLQCKVQTRD